MKQTYIKVEETYDVVTNGLILYLDAKDSNSYPGTGNIWYDISGNNHHAYGDPNDGGAGILDTRFPTYQTTDGGRFYFDGTKGLTIPTDMGNHTELTADFWCYRDSSSGTQYFFDGRNDGGTYWLTNYLDYNIYISFGGDLLANDPATYNATSNWWFRWVNITITVNSSGSALYIDGQQITDSRLISSDTFSANLGNYFRIGNRYTSLNEWIGYWSNIRFYNRVLSSTEIEQNYKAVNGDSGIVWKPVTNVWVNNSGTWVDKVVPKINISGTWKAAMEYITFPTNGLTAYYRFDDSSSQTTFTDSYGSTDGTLSTTNVWTSSGKNNQGIEFTSSSEYATASSSSSISFSSSFSISVWINQNTTPSNEGFVLHKEKFPYNYRINTVSDNNVDFIVGINGNFDRIRTTYNGFTNNTWHHIVAIYDSSSGKKLYIDNVLRASNTATGTLTTGNMELWFGRYSDVAGTYDYKGRIDELAFFNRVLTETEIGTIYNNGDGLFY